MSYFCLLYSRSRDKAIWAIPNSPVSVYKQYHDRKTYLLSGWF